MPTLQQIRLTPLNPVLKSRNAKLYPYTKKYPGLAVLRLDRSTFWVHDVKSQLGVVVTSIQVAEEVLKELAQEF
jgi:hypothetical protein